MRKILFILYFLFPVSLYSQTIIDERIKLTVSPSVVQSEMNIEIIKKLELFLQTKNENANSNRYWHKNDFETFVYPYREIFWIESGKLGTHFYQPTLMEIIETDNPFKKLVKLAYIGHNTTTKENLVRIIYNIVANKTDGEIFFSSYTDFATSSWKRYSKGSIDYVISPNKKLNKKEIKSQLEDVEKLVSFFSTDQISITYYSCIDAIELFNVKGFDYHSSMYLSKNGGLAEDGSIVYSANNSEIYTHEIAHVYTRTLFPFIPTIIDEGIATFFGGSGFNDYKWHKNELKKYIEKNTLEYSYYIDKPYERFYINNETPVPYLIGALICEYAITYLGKEMFVESLRQIDKETSVWELMNKWGLTKENINTELNKML